MRVVGAVAPSVAKYLGEKLDGKGKVSVPEMNALLLAKLIENNERFFELEKQNMDILGSLEIVLKNHIGHEETVLRELEGCMRNVKVSLELLSKKF